MPTGYTAGLLDGSISTFSEFAKICIRAFGAAMHLRDQDLRNDYKEAEPTDYYLKEIERAKSVLNDAENLTDEIIIHNKKIKLEEERNYHLKSIDKINTDKRNLNIILLKVIAWEPPTEEHTGLKEFMIDQLKKTISFDCNPEFNYKRLAELDLVKLDAKLLREEMISTAERDLEYNAQRHSEELKRCKNSNEWVAAVFDSIEPLNTGFSKLCQN